MIDPHADEVTKAGISEQGIQTSHIINLLMPCDIRDQHYDNI